MSTIAMWAVPGGVIGARLYHVLTDWKSFRGDWFRVVKIWQGGLGIWGGVLLGTIVGIWAARRRGISARGALIAAAPALPLAQAIGRLGNWWNQELFGRPTTLPWALRVDPEFRPVEYADFATFHPTFLYEGLWNVGLCAVLVWLDRKRNVAAGKLFAIYVAGYTFARFFIERMRVDSAYRLWGLRINEWVAGLGFLLAAAYIAKHRRDQWTEGEGRIVGAPSLTDASDAEETVAPENGETVSGHDEIEPTADELSTLEPTETEELGDVAASEVVEASPSLAGAEDDASGPSVVVEDGDLGPAAGVEDGVGVAKAKTVNLGLDEGDSLLD